MFEKLNKRNEFFEDNLILKYRLPEFDDKKIRPDNCFYSTL